MQQLSVGEFTLANALAMLVTTESLLFAGFALSVNMAAPTARLKAWVVGPAVVATAAVLALVLVAAGAFAAWHEIFVATEGFPSAFPEQLIAIGSVSAILIQPVLAFFLVLGLRARH